MTRTALVCAMLVTSTGLSFGQDSGPPPERDLTTTNHGAGIRAGNITSTGATVPNPGASQSAGTTSLDRGIQAEDNKIDSGICKGC